MRDEKPEKLSKSREWEVPPAVRDLLQTAGQVAERMGVGAYAVGGLPRDMLMARPNLDIDITVEGDGIAYARALGEALGAYVTAVPRFGTAHLRLPGQSPDLPARVDVATARRETYAHPGALPAVEWADIKADLYRRDFTINAMAIRLEPQGPGALVDYFGGVADLAAGQIRILHPLSFVDDPTRLLRAVRFAQRYGFRLEAGTREAARTAVAQGCLGHVSMQRLSNELLLILREPQSGGALAVLNDLGVLAWVLPGVTLSPETQSRLDRAHLLDAQVPELTSAAAVWVTKLILLLHTLPVPEAAALTARLKLRREPAQALGRTLAAWPAALAVLRSQAVTPAQVAEALRGWSPEGLLFLYLLGAGEPVTRYWQEWRHVRLAITGADLIRAGVPAGPAVGRALTRALADRLNGAAPDPTAQVALALRYAYEEA